MTHWFEVLLSQQLVFFIYLDLSFDLLKHDFVAAQEKIEVAFLELLNEGIANLLYNLKEPVPKESKVGYHDDYEEKEFHIFA